MQPKYAPSDRPRAEKSGKLRGGAGEKLCRDFRLIPRRPEPIDGLASTPPLRFGRKLLDELLERRRAAGNLERLNRPEAAEESRRLALGGPFEKRVDPRPSLRRQSFIADFAEKRRDFFPVKGELVERLRALLDVVGLQ